jgi:hypothetical protein
VAASARLLNRLDHFHLAWAWRELAGGGVPLATEPSEPPPPPPDGLRGRSAAAG